MNRNTATYNKGRHHDSSSSVSNIRLAFEDGFYIRWHHFIATPIDDKFKDNSTLTNDTIKSEENLHKTFDKYCRMHPSTSERKYHRYSYNSGDIIGLYDLLISNGAKYQSTAKCLTNITAFFISKEKLLEIFNTYSLWSVAWLKLGTILNLNRFFIF